MILGMIRGLDRVIGHSQWYLIVVRESPIHCTSDLHLFIIILLVVYDIIQLGHNVTQVVPEYSALLRVLN